MEVEDKERRSRRKKMIRNDGRPINGGGLLLMTSDL